MSFDLLFVSGLLAVTIALFVSDRLRLDLVALLALLTLMLSGVISVSEGLAGFADPIVLMIAGLFVVGAGLLQTGVADALGEWLRPLAGKSELRLVLVIMRQPRSPRPQCRLLPLTWPPSVRVPATWR